MNNNDNKRELTYNEAKTLLAKMYSDRQQNIGLQNNLNNSDVEFSEEYTNNTDNQMSEKLNTDVGNNNDVNNISR